MHDGRVYCVDDVVLIANVPLHTDNCVLIVTERTVSIANIMTID